MKDFRPRVPRGPAVGSLCQHLQLCPSPLPNTDLVLASRLYPHGSLLLDHASHSRLPFVGLARLQPPRCLSLSLPAAELEGPAVGKPQSWSRLKSGRWGVSCTEGARWEAG